MFSDITSISGFDNCANLKTVTMGDVGSIGEFAFAACSNLTNICFKISDFSRIDPNAFYSAGSSSGVHIYSNIEIVTDQSTVRGWFSGKPVTFHPYSPGPQNIPALPSLL